MANKKVRTSFDKFRLTLRAIGIFCALFPVVSYMVFAVSFQRIQTVTNYEAARMDVIKDSAYEISQIALPIANFGWTYVLPFFFPILIFEIVVAIRRQYVNGERKLY